MELLISPKHFTFLYTLQYSLHVAAGKGDLKAVKAHVHKGADVNTKDAYEVSIRETSRKL